LVLVAIAVVVAVAAALVFVPNAECIFNSEKAWEFTTQFFFVVVLGGLVGFAARRREVKRADDKQRLDEET
jgi:hypothetical protein